MCCCERDEFAMVLPASVLYQVFYLVKAPVATLLVCVAPSITTAVFFSAPAGFCSDEFNARGAELGYLMRQKIMRRLRSMWYHVFLGSRHMFRICVSAEDQRVRGFPRWLRSGALVEKVLLHVGSLMVACWMWAPNPTSLLAPPAVGVDCDGTDFRVGRDPPNSGRGAGDRDHHKYQRELKGA
eukprot:FR744007.1.p1 GENE.FR744007.1~~FR744007.1.p1  ORF type:complete len:183 (+),score=13.83 FR744007.1:307-855(+)